jgi:hypothetical protein
MISKLLHRFDFTSERTISNSGLHQPHYLRIPVSDKPAIENSDNKLDNATPEAIPISALLCVRDSKPLASLPAGTEYEKRLKPPLKRRGQVNRDTTWGTQVNRLEGRWPIS